MPYETCGLVLWDRSPFTLGDEPLPGRLEHSAIELWVTSYEPSLGFDYPVYGEVRK